MKNHKDNLCCSDSVAAHLEKRAGGKVSYTCPMHPDVIQETGGICPECGMNLVPTQKTSPHQNHVTHGTGADFDKHAGHSTNIFRAKFWVSFVLSIPVVLYSDITRVLFGWEPPQFTGSSFLPFLLTSIIFFYGGWVFLQSAWRELRARLPGMMTLISLAILAAYLYSIYVVSTGGEHTLFWELATLITVMLLGHWIEMRAVGSAQSALKELSKLLPDTAEVVQGEKMKTISLSGIKTGDIVFVRPGGKIPTDGVVVRGSSDVIEALLTGESKPVSKKEGSNVIAGTINGDGSLRVRVTKIGEHTFLAGVMKLVAEAQASKSRLQILSDRAAFYLTIVAVIAGVTTLIAWLVAGKGTAFAMERFVAVLVIACPHALGLAIPLVASISTTKAAQNGFLVRQRLSLELARQVDTVLFDKTGTLTKGEYGVTNTWVVKAKSEKELLQLAASLDSHSEHPISRAIVEKARDKNIPLREVKNFLRIPGKGVRGTIDGSEVAVGGSALVQEISIPRSREIEGESNKGKTVIYVLREKELLGIFALADMIRDESRTAIRDLKALGIRVAMITGDSKGVAQWVAGELGIDEYFARVLPHEKVEKVKLLQSAGRKVAIVGDGINDAPALTQADLGVAIGAGTNVAIESAGIVLVKNDPRDIVKIIRLSRLTYMKMIQNLFWATGYNIVALPLAAGALAFKGILLQPAVAALFMSLSTVIVAFNAVLLKRSSLD